MVATIFGWLLLVVAARLAGWPLVYRLVARHADAGWGLAGVVFLQAFTFLVFAAGSSSYIGRSRLVAFLAFAGLCAVSGVIAVLFRQEVVATLRARHREVLISECLFLVSFFFFLVPLLFTDTSRFGERAMDLAILNELTHPGTLPPTNPFFSDTPLNYYYLGHLTFASLASILGLAATDAYLLATATVSALAVTTVWSLLSRLVPKPLPRVLPLALLCFGTNLGALRALFVSNGGEAFLASNWLVGNAINEYPMYTFLIAELHAHAMAVPIFVASLALAFTLADRVAAHPEPVEGRAILAGLAYALVTGALGPTSTWSLLTAIAAGGVIVLTRSGVPVVRALALFSASVIAALLLYAEYYLHLQTPGMGLGVVGTLTSAPIGFLLHWGAWLWIAFAGGAISILASRPEGVRATSIPVPVVTFGAGGLVIALILHAAILGNPMQSIALALAVIAAVVCALAAWRSTDGTDTHGALGLAALGFLVVAACELVYLDDRHTGGLERATTVFKFYLDAWLLIGIGLTSFLAAPRPLLSSQIGAQVAERSRSLLILIPAVVLLVLSAGATVRGVLAKTAGFSSEPILDATHFLERKDSDYFATLRWLTETSSGAKPPIIAEVVSDDRESNWLAVASPAHAFVAWPQQLVQWGTSERELRARMAVLEEIYRGGDARRVCTVMKLEGIDLVCFGRKEAERFGAQARAKFLQPPMRTVFESGTAGIYACAGA